MTTETLNDSAAPSNGEVQAPASAPATDTVPTQPASDTLLAEAVKADTPADVKPEDQKPAEEAPKPVEYDIKLQEGITANEEIIGELKSIAAEAKLDPAAAQKFADLGQKAVQAVLAKQLEQVQVQADEWEAQLRSDKDFGGDKLPQNLAVASKAVEAFATPEIKQMLGRFDAENNPHGLGLGNHPAVVKFFHAIGSKLSEDGFVGGNGPGSQMDAVQKLYNNTKTK